ncbi:MAG TPA: DUF58 domain-containing protein, partial [Ktedonobacterales bacterium]|nr:DUF58 domain-containing protein [Ktedonobacterales bacterium]
MRGWQALVLVVIAGALGLATGSRSIQIATLALIVILALGVGYRALLAGDVQSVRQIGDSVIMWGSNFAQSIELTNQSRFPIPAIRISDQSTLPDHPHGYVTSLRAKRSITWEVDLPCEQRGRYRLGPVEAHMSDPLGLFPVHRELGAASSVLVLPRWVPLKRSILKLDGFMTGEARGRRRSESPPSVVSVREYAAGDSIAAIHWMASARTGQLMTKQFDSLVQTTLWLALDLDGALPRDIEELMVTAACSLGTFSLQRANLRVGLVASGAVPISLPAERGKAHQYQFQETLAEVHPGAEGVLADQFVRLDRSLGPGQV